MSEDDLAKRLKAHAAPPLPKRFYREVSVVGDEPSLGIALDGRPIRTPLKAKLAAPTHALAAAVADEWRRQAEVIDPRAMPLTRLLNTSIDRVAGSRERIVEELVAYAGCDLVCYRAEEPERLVERQAARWDPVVHWAEAALDCRIVLAAGVVHRAQPDTTLDTVRRSLVPRDTFALTAIHTMTTLTGSLLTALAVADGFLRPPDGWVATHVDEDWQIEQWGRDAEADARRAARQEEFDAAVAFLAMTRPPNAG